MKTIQIGELKAHFSEILNRVKKGDEIIISYGRKKEKIAVIMPYTKHQKNKPRKLGVLKGKAGYKINDNFEISAEELLNI